MSILIAIIIFSVIIIIHELGHFLLAKKNGIVVEEFSIGMGPRIVSTTKGGTRYSWKLLPIGGSCMMKGEDTGEDGDGTFNSKPVWARISVIAAGPIFNFILAFLLSMIITGVVGYDPAQVISVAEDSNAEAAGLQQGDIITKINGKKIHLGRELQMHFMYYDIDEQGLSLTVDREGESVSLFFQADMVAQYMMGIRYDADESPAEISEVTRGEAIEAAGVVAGDVITAVNGTAIATGADLAQYFQDNPLDGSDLEVTYTHNGKENTATITPVKTDRQSLGFTYNYGGRVSTNAWGVVKYSFMDVKYQIKSTFQALSMLVRGKLSMNDLAGPVGVVDMIGSTYERSKAEGVQTVVLTMMNMAILISANLGVMNLIPIPALDGGRLVFLLIEGIRRRPIDREKEGIVHFVGFVLLMLLMVVVLYNDLRRLF